jgi:hypothetical protein
LKVPVSASTACSHEVSIEISAGWSWSCMRYGMLQFRSFSLFLWFPWIISYSFSVRFEWVHAFSLQRLVLLIIVAFWWSWWFAAKAWDTVLSLVWKKGSFGALLTPAWMPPIIHGKIG